MRTSNHSSRFIEELYTRYPKQKLGEHISVVRGVSYKPSDVRSHNSETSTAIILRSNNISDGEINFDDLVFVVKERVQKDQELHTGDIVMCGSNGSISLVGKAGLLKTNRPNISFGAFCLGIKCKETVLPEYLNTYFNTPVYRKEIESMGNGTNIINIRPNNITNLMIPIPPSDKQKAFVDFVQQADKSKFTDFKSRFIEMFGNPNSNPRCLPTGLVSDYFTLQMGKTPARDTARYWVKNGSGNKWISIADMSRYEYFTNDTEEYISESAIKETGMKLIPRNTVIMSFKLTIGRVSVTSEPIYSNEAIVAFIPKTQDYSTRFLYYLVKYYDWLENAALAVKGKTLNKESIGKNKLIIPSRESQNEFAAFAEQADKSKYMS